MKTSEIMKLSLTYTGRRSHRRACLALFACVSWAIQSWSQDNDRGWMKREPIWNNYDLTVGNEQWLQQVEPEGRGGDPAAMMMPPDPNSQIPLTGFDYMLMASFGGAVVWLYRRQKEATRLS
jgi:hypothetical protein